MNAKARNPEGARLLTPLSQSLAQFAWISIANLLVISSIALASSNWQTEDFVSELQALGSALEVSFSWALPTAIAFVALAHVAIVGGGLNQMEHRTYLLALSATCTLVVSGIFASALVVATYWVANFEKLVFLVPLNPLILVLTVVGLQVGRFNHLDAARELEVVTSELARVRGRMLQLRGMQGRRAWKVAIVSAVVLVAPFLILLLFSGDSTELLLRFGAPSITVLALASVASLTTLSARVSTDTFGKLIGWAFLGLLSVASLLGVVVVTIESGSLLAVLLLAPLILLFATLLPVTWFASWSPSGAVDAAAMHFLSLRAGKLKSRQHVLATEIGRARISVLARLFRKFGRII